MTLRRSRRPAALLLGGAALAVLVLAPPAAAPRTFEDSYARVAHVISRATWDGLNDAQRGMLDDLASGRSALSGAHLCWAEEVPPEVMAAFNVFLLSSGTGTQFETGNRWTTTATNGSGLGQGDPTILTYSFAPDGTAVPVSGGSVPSNLFTAFNATFPSQQTWQDRIHQAFTAWGMITGTTYVFEPNDDGAPLSSSTGVLGVRGDVRIAGRPQDGPSGVLAYNSFPNNGDMVYDTDDASWYANSSNNYRRLRNVTMHEHGHGMGLFHVCPSNATKLMEPFISTAYDGPQHDDVLGGQRLYGDRFEHNDTQGTATDLGTLANGIHTTTLVSIDDNSDVDWYRFTVTGNKQLGVVLTPVGSTYLTGPQVSPCSSGGAAFDSLVLNDVGVDVRAPNGTTVLASANAAPAGQTETIPSVVLVNGPGTYYVRVFGGGTNTVQLYQVALTIADVVLPPFTISFPNGVPALVPSGQPVTVPVQTTNGTGAPNPATAQLFASVDGGPFAASPLVDQGGGLFEADLPTVSCLSVVQWYVSIAPLGGGTAIVAPEGAPALAVNQTQTVTTPLVTVFNDNMETNTGWTVVNDANLTDGAWDRGVPVGGGDRGDPPFDADGSGQCWLTDNVDGNSDVDGGTTWLISPVFDLSAYPNAQIRFSFWYDNDSGSNPSSDVFVMQISDNAGASWVTMETYNANADAWLQRSFRVGQFVGLSSQVRVRFVASDPAPLGSVVEAGLDAFRVEVCSTPPPTPALTGPCASGTLGVNTLSLNLQFGGVDRRVDVAAGGAVIVSLAQPPGLAVTAPFIIFGKLGVPGMSDATALPDGIGTMCFPPCVLSPLDPSLFILANSFGGPVCNGAVLPSAPGTWFASLGQIPVPIQVTLQAVTLQTASTLGITNGIILNVF